VSRPGQSKQPLSYSAPKYVWLTPTLAVMGQIFAVDIPVLRAAGFRTIINNRPDDEEPGQPTAAETQAAVEKAGLIYIHQPFATNQLSIPVAEALAAALEGAADPVLVHCRSGGRSTGAWAIARALTGEQSPEELINMAGAQGFDLRGLMPLLHAAAERSRSARVHKDA
jgi:sulfide:quinone oxidoreductase